MLSTGAGQTRSRLLLLRGLAGFAIALACAVPAIAAEIRVYCPNALRSPLLELARTFVRGGEHKVAFVFASVGAIHKRVASGESPDIIIGTAQGVDALVRLGPAVEGSNATIARTVLALVVRREAPIPDTASADQLVKRLRAASSLVYPDAAVGAPGGAQVEELLERLAIKAEISEKTRLSVDSREVVKRVASGAAEIGIAALSDVIGAADIAVSAAIVDPPTTGLSYAAALLRRSAAPGAGLAFVKHLTTVDAKAVFRAAGFAPAD